MNILFNIDNPSLEGEFVEFTKEMHASAFFSYSTEQSILILNKHNIEKAVISLKNLQEAAILKFINDYYPSIQVLVLANKTFNDVISIFQKSNYSVIHEPLRLAELKNQLHIKQVDFQNTNNY